MITQSALRPARLALADVITELNALVLDCYDWLPEAGDDEEARATIRALASDLSDAWCAGMRAHARVRALIVADVRSHQPWPERPGDGHQAPW